MIAALIWIAVIILVVAGISALGRRRPLTDEEYESQKGRGAGLGNAIMAFHEILEPKRGQLGKAKQELREEVDPQGDPPDPEG
jgi:hypothetical protein